MFFIPNFIYLQQCRNYGFKTILIRNKYLNSNFHILFHDMLDVIHLTLLLLKTFYKEWLLSRILYWTSLCLVVLSFICTGFRTKESQYLVRKINPVKGTCSECLYFIHRWISIVHYHLYLIWTILYCLPLIPTLVKELKRKIGWFQGLLEFKDKMIISLKEKEDHGLITISEVQLFFASLIRSQTKCISGSFYTSDQPFALGPITEKYLLHITYSLWISSIHTSCHVSPWVMLRPYNHIVEELMICLLFPV